MPCKKSADEIMPRGDGSKYSRPRAFPPSRPGGPAGVSVPGHCVFLQEMFILKILVEL